jgi:hypothetical protein
MLITRRPACERGTWGGGGEREGGRGRGRKGEMEKEPRGAERACCGCVCGGCAHGGGGVPTQRGARGRLRADSERRTGAAACRLREAHSGGGVPTQRGARGGCVAERRLLRLCAAHAGGCVLRVLVAARASCCGCCVRGSIASKPRSPRRAAPQGGGGGHAGAAPRASAAFFSALARARGGLSTLLG